MLNNRMMRTDRSMTRGGCPPGREEAYTGRMGRSGDPYGIYGSYRNLTEGQPRSGCGGRQGTVLPHGASCLLGVHPGVDGGMEPHGMSDGERRSPCNPVEMTNCEKLLEQIRAVDFALAEIILYLDSYPNSSEALDAYHKLIARRGGLYAQYETSCGPLTAMGNKNTTSWDWIGKPFPWEYKAN